ncbi:PRC-barrel domain-containing protein [Pelagicoccus albus]|uniref:PRC-barrel domain-containing protein n=1 Tax=Pelagicoccus albus TaxID=415222 RepID=A0A7X1B8H7_9BACT|nr:PRC-barrel domain-containing protein [Pelagicoccus albus]MBC2607647.1 hypothetical protein [Pelagicoccus albus]
MLRSIKDIFGYPVKAVDGKAGKVKDILFGDRNWRVRYVDVETRHGLRLNLRYLSEEEPMDSVTRRLVKAEDLQPLGLGDDRKGVPTRLTCDEVSKCDGFGSHLTAEQQYEMEFRRFYRHAIYDERPLFGSFGYAGYIPSVSAYDHTEKEVREHLDRMSELAGEHLHSARGVIGYHVVGTDENLGVVGDLIVDTDTWQIKYMVLDTRHGLPSRKYLFEMAGAMTIDWPSSSVQVDSTVADLVSLRRYWVHDPVNHDDSEMEYDYSGNPCFKNLLDEVF